MKERKIRFGPAGNPDSFYASGYKSSLDMPSWLAAMGLGAYEYQCTHGVTIGEKTARELGRLAAQHDIALSLHAPYYITLATPDPALQEKTRQHILKAMRAADWMGGALVVMHAGGGKGDRRAALARAIAFLREVLRSAEVEGLGHIRVAVETAGKVNQLGNLEEIIIFCEELGPQVVPCIDFAHLYAASQGRFAGREAFAAALDLLAARLGEEAVRCLHVHFSPIEFTRGGEKKHWTLLHPQFGPSFAPLAELIVERGLTPTIICESDGRQAEDAVAYQQMVLELMVTDGAASSGTRR